jgi:hypothetical protein
MKKHHLIFTLVLALFVSIHAKAQTTATAATTTATTTTDYFPGKWNVIIMGTPNGDAKLTFALERKDGKLTGAVQDSTGKELSKITQVDEKDKTMTAYFNMMNYDLTLMLEPIDDDHVKGNMLGMFDAKGVRAKENK